MMLAGNVRQGDSFGTKVAAKANYVLMAFQLLVLVFFVALSVGSVVSADGAGGLASGQPFFTDTASSAGPAIVAPITLQIGGQLFGAVFLAGLVMAQFVSGLAAQPLPVAVHDGPRSCPAQDRLRAHSEKFHTPVANLVITGIVGVIAIFLDVATSTPFTNFRALTAFTLMNASVEFHYMGQRRARQQLNPVSYVVVPVIGAYRRAGPAGLLVLSAGRAQDGAVAGAERGARYGERCVFGRGV